MFANKRKIFGAILGCILFLGVVLAFSYARYVWKSDDTVVTFNISDSYFYCESGIENEIGGLSPTLDYRDGTYQTFMVNNIGRQDTTFSLSLNISQIDSSLLVDSFKYKLMVDQTGGSNNCADTDNSNCVAVTGGSGDFSDFKVGMNTLVETVTIPNNVRYQYYLFIYIDGNMENDVSMQSSAMTATLDVCEIVVFLDYKGGNVTSEFLKVTDTYAGLPTPTRGNTTVTYNTNGGSSVSGDSIGYTFDGWYLEESFKTEITTSTEVVSTTNHTLYAKWIASKDLTLPTTTRTGYTFKGWYSDSGLTNKVGDAGGTYAPNTTNSSITLYAKWVDETAPASVAIGTTSTLKATSQTATLKCTDGVGVTSYYWGTSAPTSSSTYTSITSTTSMSVTKTVSSAGTYYLACKDAAGNTSTTVNRVYRSYVVNNMLDTLAGTQGTYTTANYEQKSTNTYIAPNGTSLTLASIYTAPGTIGTQVAFVGVSTGAASTTAATVSTTAPTLSANTTYTMWFNRKSYAVTLNKGTGISAVSGSGSKKWGASVTINATVSTGYTWSNWTGYSTTTTQNYTFTMPAQAVTYTANATANTYHVTYDANGGTGAPERTYYTYAPSGYTKLSTTVPTREGYTFLGWDTSKTATTATYQPGGDWWLANADYFTLYAVWTANTYTIKYDYQNNIYDPDTSTWSFNGSSAVNTNYTYNSTTGVAVYSNTSLYTGVQIPLNNDRKTNTDYEISVRAYRTESFSGNLRVYSTTYDSSGGALSYNHPINITTSNLTTNTWTLYTGTFNSGAYSSWPRIHIDYDTASQGPVYISDIRLDEISTVTKTHGSTLGTLPTPTRTGYTFNGWYTAESGGTQVSSSTTVSADQTLYAQWTINTYTIKYDYQNNVYNQNTSSWTFQGSSAVNTSYTYNSTTGVAVYSNTSQWTGIRIPLNSDKKQNTKYEFSVMAYRTGDFTGSLRAYTPIYDSEGTVQYTCVMGISTSNLTTNTWQQYTCQFDSGAYSSWDQLYIDYDTANQGPVYVSDIRLDEISTTTKNYGTALGTLPTPTRTGYTFKGWYTAASGGTQVTSTTKVSGDQTLYAQWTVNTYTVNFHPMGGTTSTASKSVTFASTYGTLPTPTLTGYTFNGWYNTTRASTVNIASSTANYNYQSILSNLVPGVTYTVSMDSAILNSGTATEFSVLIYDFTASTSLASLRVSFSNSSISVDIGCPWTATATNDIRLLIYAGVSGSTSGNSVTYTNLKIGTMDSTTSTAYTSTSTVSTGRNHVLFAWWTAYTYTVTYYNATSKLGTSSHTYGTAKALTTWSSLGGTVTNSSVGWSFAGWSTSASNTTRTYTDGQSVTSLTSTSGGNVNLYAVYTRTITFKHGSNSASSSTATQYWNPYGTTNGSQIAGVTSPSLTAISGWSSSGFRNDGVAGSKGYDPGTTIYPAVNGSATLYGIYTRTATFYSGVSTNKTTATATQYYNSKNVYSVTTPSSITTLTNWSALGWRPDTIATTAATSAGSASTSSAATFYATYSKTWTFYSGASNATNSGTRTQYYNTNGGVSAITTYTPAAITSWSTLGWRDDTTASSSEYASATSVSPAYSTATAMRAVYSRTLTISYNGNGNTGGSTTSTTKTVYLNSNSTTTSSQAVTLASNGFTKTGASFSKWAAGSTSGTQYAAGATYTPTVAYNASTFGVTMYAVWSSYKVTIRFNVNASDATLKASGTHDDGVTYSWSKDSNGLIYRTAPGGSATADFLTLNYGSSLSSDGLPNWHNDGYIYITRTGYMATTGAHWICLSGCTTANKTFNQATVYTSTDFCNAASANCTVTLGVNWRVSRIYYNFYVNGGTIKSTTSTSDGATTYTWTVGSDGLIYRSTNGGTATANFWYKNYGATDVNLPNHDNQYYIYVTKSGYVINKGAEWNTNTSGTGTSFSDDSSYSASQFCDASTYDCTVKLYLNWKSENVLATIPGDWNIWVNPGYTLGTSTVNFYPESTSSAPVEYASGTTNYTYVSENEWIGYLKSGNTYYIKVNESGVPKTYQYRSTQKKLYLKIYVRDGTHYQAVYGPKLTTVTDTMTVSGVTYYGVWIGAGTLCDTASASCYS